MTFVQAVRLRLVREGARVRCRGQQALGALAIAMVAAACGESDGGAAPTMPGSISVTTETSGFMKDDGYELLLDGASAGAIGANDQVTLAELDPATYGVALGDVAENCLVDDASVPVASEETAEVPLSVVCAFATPTAYTIRFSRDRPNLDNGAITDCLFGICSTTAEWDMYVHYNSQTTPRSVIRQNLTNAVEIAHLPGVSLTGLTEADVASATFTTSLVADPFDSGRVILIKTELGAVYALGNPVEDTMAQTLTFDAALISVP
jgi:hypothetical protein